MNNYVAAKNHAFWQADPICCGSNLSEVNARNYILREPLRLRAEGEGKILKTAQCAVLLPEVSAAHCKRSHGARNRRCPYAD